MNDGLASSAAVDDDWFGEGSAFDSQEQLAAALHELDAAPDADAVDEAMPSPLEALDLLTEEPGAAGDTPDFNGHIDHDGELFELMEPRGSNGVQEVAKSVSPRVDTAVEPKVPTWSVRVPGVQLLPQRQAGRSGWSMHNSVRILRQAEQLVYRLREEAVVSAFTAAARALRGDDERPPRDQAR